MVFAGPRALEPGYTGQYLYRNDNFRTGQNLAETVLTPSTVNASQFGLQFTDAIDGYAYAEPLYVPAVAIPGNGTHNVVYVATENDSVYAFDADAPGSPLWQTSFINPQANPPITAVPATDLGCGDLVPIIGITATPVIDSTSGTMYVVSKEKLGPGSYRQRLHALDITTGLERSNSPVTITATAPGTASDGNGTTVTFNPLTQLGRPALTLSNGIVYLAFASHCDIDPFHGWVLGYDETKLTQEVVFNTTPNGTNGGIWQSGCGLGVDTNGDLIAITGDGVFDTGASPQDFGDSFLRLTPNPGATVSMTVASSFTPLNELMLEDQDLDMGSGGNLLLPDQPGPYPHLMIGVGKSGSIYLVNRDNMGGFNASQDQMVQEILLYIDGIFSTPAYWQGNVPAVGLQNMVYMIPAGGFPDTFVLSNGMIQTPPAATASNYKFGFPGASPMISANGTSGGILWAIDSSAYSTSGPAILRAFDPTNLSSEFYDSNQFSSDNPGPAVNFSVPTIANGSVYVGTETQLAVFGLFPSGARPSPTASATATATATSGATATASATVTVTATPQTATPTASATATVTSTATATITPTSTATSTATPTITATVTATATPSATITATATMTPSASATNTLTPTASATATSTATHTATTTNTATRTPTATATASASPTQTQTPTTTATGSTTPTITATVTATATPSATITVTATMTPSASATNTTTPTASATATSTATQTATSTNTATSTATPTASASASPTQTPTTTGSATPTPTATVTATATPSAIITATATMTPSATATNTLTPTASATATSTATQTATSTNTATSTATPTASASASPTRTSTATATESVTATVTPTATGTATPTPTVTETPSATPTPGSDQMILKPHSLSFGNEVLVGTTSAARAIRIENVDHKKKGLPIEIQSVSASPSMFAIRSECKQALAAGKACKVLVTFKPANTTPQSGTVTIYDNASGSPQSVRLSGTGKSPKAKN